MKKFILYPISIVSMLLCSTMLFATNYYASPSGTTANNGLTAATPTTIVKAINTKATTAGDSVILAAGTYYPTAQLIPLAGISIVGAGSASTVIDCSSYSTGSYTTDISLFKLTQSNISIIGITIQKCYYTNIWNSMGGAMYIKGSSSLSGITISDVTFKSNKAVKGAAIYAENTTLAISNSTFSGNTIGTSYGGYNGSNGYGGAMDLTNCTTTIDNTDITGNYAEWGSGIYVSGGTLTMTNSIVENNGVDVGTTNTYYGGGIDAMSATVTIKDSKIRNNISFYGGGIYASSGTLTVTNTNIYDNSVAPSATGQGYGGGLYLYNNTTSLTSCSLADNVAGLAGGAIYICGGTTNITSCTISYNDKNIDWISGTAGISVNCSGSLNLANSILSGNVNVEETWSTGDANLNGSVSSSTITVTNSVVGTTYYNQNEVATTNAFNPTTDLGGVDSNGDVIVKKAKNCTWLTTTTSTNWSLASNWKEGYVPLGYSNAIIPSGAVAYPILTATSVCDSIFFKAGAEVGQPQYLSYQAAAVDMPIARSKWYLINPPLKNVYSGDYTFAGLKPLTYIRDWSVAVQTGASSVYWATAISNLDVAFGLGKSFVFYLTSTDLSTKPDTITFPGKATAYQYYYTNNLLSPVATGTYTSTLDKSKCSRFIYENSSNVAPTTSFTETVTTSGTVGAYYVVGNPFMSHLDFSKFYTQNSGAISPEVKLWDSSSKQFVTYNSSNLANAPIPPMQSFIVKLLNSGTTTVTFTYTMSKTDVSSKLKTATVDANILHIKATKSTDVSNISLAFKNNDSIAADTNYVKNTERLFCGMVTTTPTLYAYVDSQYLDFHTASDSTIIPIGIKTTSSGSTTLTFNGMDNFDACSDVIFVDSLAGVRKSLIDSSTYNYTFNNSTGNVIGRFYIQFMPLKSAAVGEVTGEKLNSALNGIEISAVAKKIKVSSAASTINKVSIYDLQGRLIVTDEGINSKSTEVSVNGANTYVVKCSDNAGNTKTEKIVVQ